MKITKSADGWRGLPPIIQVEAVLGRLCERAGMAPGSLTASLAGHCDDKKYDGIGVRIINFRSSAPYTLQILIGTEDGAARAFINYDDGVPLTGKQIYDLLIVHAEGNRKEIDLRVEPQKEPVSEKSGSANTDPADVNPDENPDAGASPEPGSEPKPEPNSATEIICYKGYFNDEENLQTAVIALLAKFDLHTEFGSAEFGLTLIKELKLQAKSDSFYSTIGRFKARGYVVDIEGSRPTRYKMTEAASEFAMETLPKSPEKVKRAPRKPSVAKTEAAPETAAPAAKAPVTADASAVGHMTPQTIGALIAELAELKESEKKFQAEAGRMAQLDAELEKHHPKETAQELAENQQEIKRLTEVLQVLRNRTADLEHTTGIIRMLQQERDARQAQLASSDLGKKHSEYVELHQQLEQLKELLA